MFRQLVRARVMAACVAMTLGTSATAGVFYNCSLNTATPNGWVSPKLGIVIDDAGKVTVIDAIILNFIGDPVVGKVRRRNGKLRVTWSVSGARDSMRQRIPTIRYVATITEETRAVTVLAKPTSAPQRWSAKGTCRLRTGDS